MDTLKTLGNEHSPILCLVDPWPRPEDDQMENWFDRAKAAMKRANITHGQLAEHFGMTPAGMGKWLSGKRDPTLADLVRIADFIGIPRAELLLGPEEPTRLQGLPDYAAEPIELMITGARSGRLDAHWFQCLALTGNLIDQARAVDSESSFGAYLAAKEPPLSADAMHLAREYDKVTDESQRRMVFAQTEHLLRLLGRPAASPGAGTKARPSRRSN